MTSGGGFGGSKASTNGASSSAAETAEAVKNFKALGVCDQLAEAAAALGWTAPTDIQAAAVPHLLAGASREKRKERRAGEREGEIERRRHSTSTFGDGLLSF